MKDGVIEQCDIPDQIVLNPMTEYVRKFTEDIDKAHVVTASAIMTKVTGSKPAGKSVDANAKLHDLAKLLASDSRKFLPVSGGKGKIIGQINRKDALDIIFGGNE
jgi:glycine betaine/proline transport system ATP-binding protein